MRLTRRYEFRSKPLPPKPTAVGLGIVGTILLAVAAAVALSTYKLKQTGVRATATVVELERSEGSYFPVFAFEDSEGRRHAVRSNTSSKSYLEGDTVAILYPPGRPLDARIDNAVMLYLLPGIFLLLGVGFLGGTLLVLKALPYFERRYDEQRQHLE